MWALRFVLLAATLPACLARPAGAGPHEAPPASAAPAPAVTQGASASAFAAAPADSATAAVVPAPSAAPGAAPETDAGTAVPAAAPLPAFEVETPYPPGERPRPAGLVAASADDELVARWNVGGNGDPAHPSRRPGFHPAVRVTVEVRPLARLPRGKVGPRVLTEARLLAQARSKGYWPFRSCYETALRRSPRDAGATRARVSIAPNGRVIAARLLATRFTDREGPACLLRALRALRFDPAPARRLDADVSIDLWPGDAPLPPIAGAARGPAFDPRALRSRVDGLGGELGRCYVAGLERDPELWGRVALRVEVAPDGGVSSVLEDESRFPDPEVVRCLAATLRALELAPSAQPYAFILALRCGLPPEPAAPPPASPAPVAGER